MFGTSACALFVSLLQRICALAQAAHPQPQQAHLSTFSGVGRSTRSQPSRIPNPPFLRAAMQWVAKVSAHRLQYLLLLRLRSLESYRPYSTTRTSTQPLSPARLMSSSSSAQPKTETSSSPALPSTSALASSACSDQSTRRCASPPRNVHPPQRSPRALTPPSCAGPDHGQRREDSILHEGRRDGRSFLCL